MSSKIGWSVEVVKGEHTFRVFLPVGAPYADACQALEEIKMALGKMAEREAEQAKANKVIEDKPQE